MRILEPQSAILSNYEVLTHIQSVRNKTRQSETKQENVETILKEVSDYLTLRPRPPLSLPTYTSPNYTPASISTLLRRLEPFLTSDTKPEGLYKQETLMLVNLRPEEPPLLDCVVEDLDERFSDEEQQEILRIIGEVLGKENGVDGQGKEGDGRQDEQEEEEEKEGSERG